MTTCFFYLFFNGQKKKSKFEKYVFLNGICQKCSKYKKIRYNLNKTWYLQRPKIRHYFKKYELFKDISKKSVNIKNKARFEQTWNLQRPKNKSWFEKSDYLNDLCQKMSKYKK